MPVPRLRVLWLFRHRTARYEEVSALLRAGAEVVPIAGAFSDFPNALELPEAEDPWYPRWRERCTIPEDELEVLRNHDYYARPDVLPAGVRAALDRWIDVVWVGTFTRVALGLLRGYAGHVVLRPYGGYPYTGVLGPWPLRSGALDRLAASDRFLFCPALPYQYLLEDPRLTRGEVFLPACVSPDRLAHRWAGARSEPVACEAISLIGRYRASLYAEFLRDFGALPLRVFGQNPPGGPTGDDPRVVGTLGDDAYHAGIAACRLMLYRGLGSKYHLHYHALEALMMGVPVVFFSSSALAHVALHAGLDREELRALGMCDAATEATALAQRLLGDVAEAERLADRQAPLRALFAPSVGDEIVRRLVEQLARRLGYERSWRDPTDRPPARTARQAAAAVGRAVALLLRRKPS
jgi:hypothetical protein